VTQYRPEVDGLRAIAVVPVVMYHAGLPLLTGGYVGVDVFFVISGYLITSILLREIRGEGLSLVSFYDRRIRRLLPALFAVLVFTTAVAAMLLPPIPFRDYAQSLAATTVFGSNVLFFLESGYFDAAAETKPLLHTWSLAVEEQFYLVYPLLLAALVRWFNGRLFAVLATLVVLSFVASVVVVRVDQAAAFYLIPFRAWELGLGALLAVAPIAWRAGSPLPDLVRWGGVAMILVSVFSYSSATLFPGEAALLPCLGAAMVIGAGPSRGGSAFALLASRPMVFIGKISYSLYLWHWPIIVFLKLSSADGELSPTTAAFAIAASFAAAVLSWRYVEGPFRTRRVLPRTRPLFAATAAASAVWIGLGAAGHVLDGVPQRLSPAALSFAGAAEDFNPRPPTCKPWRDSEFFCVIGDPEAEPSFVFWGDSHAGILSNGVYAAARRHGRAGLYSGVGGCPPLFGVVKDESSADAFTDAACTRRNAELARILADRPAGIDTIILASRWSYYAEGGGLGVDGHNRVTIRRVGDEGPAPDDPGPLFRTLLQETASELVTLGLRPVILEQVPEFPEYSSARVVRQLVVGAGAVLEGDDSPLNVPVSVVEQRQRAFLQAVTAPDFPRQATVVRTRQLFCESGRCSVIRDGRPAYFDNNHVTTSTAVHIGELLDPVFAGVQLSGR